MSRIGTSVLYINFSPYENAGSILDFLRANFRLVCLFSLNFHKLGSSKEGSSISIYKNGKLMHSKRLYTIIIPHELVFLLLPIRSVIIFSQIIWYAYLFKRQYGSFAYVLSVNAFTTWIANILRTLKVVHSTIFWVWDYYPTVHSNKLIAFMRWIYLFFDMHATQKSDRVVFLNKRLIDIRVQMGMFTKHSRFRIVPIGTHPIDKLLPLTRRVCRFAFFGVVKHSQGLGVFLDAYPNIRKRLGPVELHVVGSGPQKEYFQDLCRKLHIPATFYGYVNKESIIKSIIMRCHIGLAPYVPGESNVSFYTDPSKIKQYLSLGLPVITTDTCSFAKELKASHAGEVFTFGNEDSFINGVERIYTNHPLYRRRALQLAQTYSYLSLYRGIFWDNSPLTHR